MKSKETIRELKSHVRHYKKLWKSEINESTWRCEGLKEELQEAVSERDKKIKNLTQKIRQMETRHTHDRQILQDYIDAEYNDTEYRENW